jgi:hypothetical protein
VRLILHIKQVKPDVSDIASVKPNIDGCVNYLLHSMINSLSVSLNGKPATLHETNYHYKAYLEKRLNYGSYASCTHLVPRFWNFDSPSSDGAPIDSNGYEK